MSSPEIFGDRDEVEARLVDRALADDTFHARLLAEPKAAIADELGTALPEGLEVEILEEQPGKLYLVLPMVKADLSDEALDEVAGGNTAGVGWQNSDTF